MAGPCPVAGYNHGRCQEAVRDLIAAAEALKPAEPKSPCEVCDGEGTVDVKRGKTMREELCGACEGAGTQWSPEVRAFWEARNRAVEVFALDAEGEEAVAEPTRACAQAAKVGPNAG